MTSPTQRALKAFKDRGCKACITEKWNAFAKIRQDVFGFGDLLVICQKDILLVQVTSGTNHSARRNKIEGIQEAKDWINAGGKILVMSFTKRSNGRYVTREEFINFIGENNE